MLVAVNESSDRQPTHRALLVVVTGLQGTGKSTIAGDAAAILGAPLLAHDWAMSGLRPYAEMQKALDSMEPPGHGIVGWSILSRARPSTTTPGLFGRARRIGPVTGHRAMSHRGKRGRGPTSCHSHRVLGLRDPSLEDRRTRTGDTRLVRARMGTCSAITCRVGTAGACRLDPAGNRWSASKQRPFVPIASRKPRVEGCDLTGTGRYRVASPISLRA